MTEKPITTFRELARLGIEETERERLARGVPPETEALRASQRLPPLKDPRLAAIKRKWGVEE